MNENTLEDLKNQVKALELANIDMGKEIYAREREDEKLQDEIDTCRSSIKMNTICIFLMLIVFIISNIRQVNTLQIILLSFAVPAYMRNLLVLTKEWFENI